MENKNIFASLDIGSKITKLVVGEFHNTKINILKVQTAPTMGVSNNMEIFDVDLCSQVVKKLIEQVQVILGFKINSVLLSIPSVDITVLTNKSTISINNPQQKVTQTDLETGIRIASNINIDSKLIIVNTVPVRYHVGQIAMRKAPIGEVTDYLTTECMIFCANKKVVFDYVRCVEMAGVEILDICLDAFASAKECAVLERSLEQNIIFMNIGANNTVLSLYSQGSLKAIDVLSIGSMSINDKIATRFNLPLDVSEMVKVKNGLAMHSYASDDPIYINVSDDTDDIVIQEKALVFEIDEGLSNILSPIKPFIDSYKKGKLSVIITGGCAELPRVGDYCNEYLGVNCSVYIPETLGARKANLVTCLGLMYAYIDSNYLNIKRTSVDSKEFENSLNPKQRGFGLNSNQEDGFLKKLKSFIFTDKN